MKKRYTNFITLVILSLSILVLISSGCSKSGDPGSGIKKTPPDTVAITNNITVALSPTKVMPNSVVDAVYAFPDGNYTSTINGLTAEVAITASDHVEIQLPPNATSGKVQLIAGNTRYTASTNLEVESTSFSVLASNVYMETIAVDAAGNVYGTGLNVVNKITPAGTVSVLANLGAKNVLLGIACDAAGNVYTTSVANHVIYKITPAGTVSIFAGSGAAAYTDGQGTSAQFLNPFGLAIDGSGNLYVTDSYRIREISPSGVVTTIAGSTTDGDNDGIGIGNAHFGLCGGIAADAAGNVYISDVEHKKIKKIFAGGFGGVTTIAGNGTAAFADGDVGNSEFAYPQGLAVNTNGDVFVADNLFDSNEVSTTSTVRMVNRINNTFTFVKSAAGATGAGAVNTTDGIAFDSAGNMYISNTVTPQSITKVTIK
jgi:hypothetical protein